MSMEDKVRESLMQKLVQADELRAMLKVRKREYVLEDIPKDAQVLEQYIDLGWELQRELKDSYRMKTSKAHDVHFEDRVWCVLAQLGFTYMNSDRQFAIPYDKKNPKLSQQIDVFAVDEESILYVECKSSKEKGRGDFKKTLEAYKGIKGGLENSIKKMFPDSKPKMKFILATENKTLGELDAERLKNLGGIHLDEEAVKYYLKMYDQIGIAARYQLLGSLFAGLTIPNLDNQIPAIRGKMGSKTYYSFSIEPDKLLKIGYVLHRNKANKKMMPTYQRVIKKSRLKAISSFIQDEGGFFPNSVIISLQAKAREVRFEPANTQVKGAISRVGILSIPQKYRSAYIIDGQHRLYGYANTQYSKSNSIPVVAFLNLEREEQVNLFMQINENQKAVPKTLRETLNSDLLWTSENLLERRKAFCSRISIYLGEEADSPFYDYISLGEDNRVITPASISNAIIKSNYFGKVNKDSIETLGLFYRGDMDLAFHKLYEFLRLSFDYLTKTLYLDWELRKESFLFVNKGIYGVIRLLSDILDHLQGSGVIDTLKNSSADLFSNVQKYLDPLVIFVREMDTQTRTKFKGMKGASAPIQYWRRFQQKVKESYPEFKPPGLDEYIRKEERALNVQTFEMIKDLEEFMRKDFKAKLLSRFGEEWAWKKGVPVKIQDAAMELMIKKNRTRAKDDETEEWDNLNLIHYKEIARQNWQYVDDDKKRVKFFEAHYTVPSEESKNKDEKTKWWTKLNELRNIVSHVSNDQISEEDFEFVLRIHNWLVMEKTKNRWQTELEG